MNWRDQFVPRVRQPFDNRIITFARDDAGAVTGCVAALRRVRGHPVRQDGLFEMTFSG